MYIYKVFTLGGHISETIFIYGYRNFISYLSLIFFLINENFCVVANRLVILTTSKQNNYLPIFVALNKYLLIESSLVQLYFFLCFVISLRQYFLTLVCQASENSVKAVNLPFWRNAYSQKQKI